MRKRYPHYKPSGVEWLGEVPAHWEVKRLRHELVRNDGGVWGDEDSSEGTIVLRSTEQTLDGGWRIDDPARRLLSESEKCDYVLETGDLVVTKSSGSALHIGKASLVTEEVASLAPCFSNFMQRLRLSRSVDPRLGFYLLNCPTGRQQLVFNSNTTTGLANLNGSVLGNVFFGFPTIDEQRAIADFLDAQTLRLDTLVAKKRTLIERLKEKRTALISRTVTRGLPPDAARAAGLDPHPKLKPSGIDWLGDVPEHWCVKRLKFILSASLKYGANEAAEFDDSDLPRYVRITDIDENDGLREDTFKSLPADVAAEYLLREGDLLFARSGATAGKTFLYRSNWGQYAYAGYLIRARLDTRKAVPAFIRYFTASSNYWQWLASAFIQATIQNVSAERYAGLWLPLAPRTEQKDIANFLDRETATIDGMVAKVETAIERLQEYRGALITAAVTGKIDVRGVVGRGELSADVAELVRIEA